MQPQHLPPRPSAPQPQPLPAATGLQQQAEEQPQGLGAAQMAMLEDARKACNPDFRTPFVSLEDAICRLLPYHVFADYQSDEDDELHTNGFTGALTTRSQMWNDAVEAEASKLWALHEKQVKKFNVMARQRAQGMARAEERLRLEHALLEDERQRCLRATAVVRAAEAAQHVAVHGEGSSRHGQDVQRGLQVVGQRGGVSWWPSDQRNN